VRPGEQERGQAPWRERRPSQEWPSACRYLLDLDADLAEELEARVRLAARPAVTAVTFDVDPGEVRLEPWLALARRGPGLLILSGVVALSVRVGDRTAAELLGHGDLLQACEEDDEEELLSCDLGWRALLPTRFAVLDLGFSERVRPWPQIADELLRRASRRSRRLGVQRAIASQPRLEVRLALLLWHLSSRWGRVEPGGIRLSVPLTHQLLGRLVGAERPSVSHALARLAGSGLVSGHGDEWHLHGSFEEQLALMVEPSSRVEELATAIKPLARGQA
jgi:CRP/FNR family transcriptional regulator, cyclic AMP receptor protein